MNQILFVQEKRSRNPQDTKKIVSIFAVLIIIFGCILLGEGVKGVLDYQKNKTGLIQTESTITQIDLSQTPDGKVQIAVNSKTAIAELTYYWNSEASRALNQQDRGQTNIQETIEMPVGENILTVKTIDTEGKEAIKQQTFTLNVDKPIINLSSIVGNNIKILVESKVDISYVTYKWNSGKEEKIDMVTYTDKTKLEKEIEIPKGQNTLLVTAVDIYGNKSEKPQEIKGISQPTIKPIARGENLVFEIEAEESIQKVEYTFNNKNYVINSDVIKGSKTVKYYAKMVKGWNYLKITVTTTSGETKPEFFKYEYNPQ